MILRPNLDLLTVPRVIALSGRETQMRITDSQTLVTGISTNLTAQSKADVYITEQIDFGQIFDVLPTLREDGRISIKLRGLVREFMGYGDPRKQNAPTPGADIRTTPGNFTVPPPLKQPIPIIREQVFITETDVQSGETIVLSGLIVPEKRKIAERIPVFGDIPLVGRLFRSEKEETQLKYLLLMVTVDTATE